MKKQERALNLKKNQFERFKNGIAKKKHINGNIVQIQISIYIERWHTHTHNADEIE